MPRILVVDDNLDMLETLEHLFSFYDYDVLKAENGKQALKIAEEEQPEIILLDALMPVMNGFEACEQLKSNNRTRGIPVIFLSANYTDEKHRARGLELGADDYILKPFNAKDLLAKVQALLKKKQVMQKLRVNNRKLIQTQYSISEVDLELEELKKRSPEVEPNQPFDWLTGVYNNDYLAQRWQESASRAGTDGDQLAMLLLDIDFFKKVNDTFGEQTGDYVLMRVANVLLKNTNPSDFVFRVEKNRFAVILPGRDEAAAFYDAERLRSVILQTRFFDNDFFTLKSAPRNQQKNSHRVTASIGVAALAEEESASDVFRQAAEALTRAKAQGRDMTIRYSALGQVQAPN